MRHASPPFGATTVIRAPVPLTPGETFPPSDAKLMFPEKFPVAVGVKFTTTSWLAPAPMVKGLPENTEKAVEVDEALPLSVPPPMFCTVKLRLEELPTPTVPKFCDAGVTLICGGLVV